MSDVESTTSPLRLIKPQCLLERSLEYTLSWLGVTAGVNWDAALADY